MEGLTEAENTLATALNVRETANPDGEPCDLEDYLLQAKFDSEYFDTKTLDEVLEIADVLPQQHQAAARAYVERIMLDENIPW